MGLLNVFSGARRAAAAAADARVAELTMALPYDAQVTVETNKEPQTTNYSVRIIGSRTQFQALMASTGPVIRTLGRYEELDLRITESEEPGAAFSSILVSAHARDEAHTDSLVRGHDSLLALLPAHSIKVEGVYAGYTVTGVAQPDAVCVAGILVRWWEQMLSLELELWPVSGISVEIGGTADVPKISYSVDLEGPDDDSDIHQVPLEEQRHHAQRAIAAWTENLGDLEAMSKVRPRPGYGVRLGFTPTELEPRVLVEDLETGDEAEDERAEVEAGIRFHNAGSKIRS